MKKDLTLIATIIITLALMFATSLLLDLKIITQQPIREYIVYLTIGIELYFGFMLFKIQISK